MSLLYETASFNSGFTTKNPNKFVDKFYRIYSKAMGVVSLERKQLEVGDVELSDEDYEGENEEGIRVDPQDIKIEQVPE